MCRAKRLSCPRLRAVWCYQTHHISPLDLYLCTCTTTVYLDIKIRKIWRSHFTGDKGASIILTLSPCGSSLFYPTPRTSGNQWWVWCRSHGPSQFLFLALLLLVCFLGSANVPHPFGAFCGGQGVRGILVHSGVICWSMETGYPCIH